MTCPGSPQEEVAGSELEPKPGRFPTARATPPSPATPHPSAHFPPRLRSEGLQSSDHPLCARMTAGLESRWRWGVWQLKPLSLYGTLRVQKRKHRVGEMEKKGGGTRKEARGPRWAPMSRGVSLKPSLPAKAGRLWGLPAPKMGARVAPPRAGGAGSRANGKQLPLPTPAQQPGRGPARPDARTPSRRLGPGSARPPRRATGNRAGIER